MEGYWRLYGMNPSFGDKKRGPARIFSVFPPPAPGFV
jgi:hypothetical protein